MTRGQQLLIAFGLILFGVLYFGFETVNQFSEGGNKRSEDSVGEEENYVVDSDVLRNRIVNISGDDREFLDSLQAVAEQSGDVEALKSLASFWASRKEWGISAMYADRVADKERTAEAFQIAANTCAIAMKTSSKADERQELMSAALKNYDALLELVPDNLEAKINKALLWVDNPPEDQPMMGILELLQLQKEHPDQPSVLYHLGRLGMSTGQWDKARARLERAYEIAPNDKRIVCLLAELYKEIGDVDSAEEFTSKCNY